MTARVSTWTAGCALAAAALALTSCGGSKKHAEEPSTSPAQSQSSLVPGGAANRAPTIRLQSQVFADRSRLPRRFTCDGAGKSPPLSWTGVPRETRSLVLLLEDPDAPGGTFMHWSVYAIPPKVHGFAARTIPAGARQGRNSSGKAGYGPPCPPRGDRPHRYVFSLYAVPHRAAFGGGADITAVRRLAASATARGMLSATYQR